MAFTGLLYKLSITKKYVSDVPDKPNVSNYMMWQFLNFLAQNLKVFQ